MMVALLLYAYSTGVYSSRRIARACETRVDFMAVTATEKPDFRTIALFRKTHLKALGELFAQVLRLCQKADLVKLGHVALDGSKFRANASKHKAMSYSRMGKVEPEMAAEVEKWFGAAESEDESEDTKYGADRRGDELPDWVKNKKTRLEKIRAAKAELEAEGKEEAQRKEEEKAAKASESGRDPKKSKRPADGALGERDQGERGKTSARGFGRLWVLFSGEPQRAEPAWHQRLRSDRQAEARRKDGERQENTGSGNARTRDVGEAETRRPRQSV